MKLLILALLAIASYAKDAPRSRLLQIAEELEPVHARRELDCQCKEVPREECEEVSRQECQDVPHEVPWWYWWQSNAETRRRLECQTVTEQKCHTVTEQQCPTECNEVNDAF